MLFVALGHNSALVGSLPLLYRALFLFHVPLFFFVTGLTFNPAAPVPAVARRIGALLVPYLLCSVLILPQFLHDPAMRGVSLVQFALGMLYGTGQTIYDTPLWFLPCLAVALMLVALVGRIPGRIGWAVAALVLLWIGSLWFGQLSGRLQIGIGWGGLPRAGAFWSADAALIAAAFVLAGVLAAPWLRARPLPVPPAALMVLGGVLLLAWAALSGVHVDLNTRQFAPLWLATLLALAGIAATLALAQLIEPLAWLHRPLALVGQSSLVVLWLHSPLEYQAIKHLPMLQGAVLALVSTLLAVVVPVLLDQWVIRRVALLGALFYPRFGQARAAAGARA